MPSKPSSNNRDSLGPAPNANAAQISIDEAVRAVTSPQQEADSLAFQKADFEKYRKRARQELEERELKAREEILGDFLEVADNLERALTSWKEGDKNDVHPFLTGVDLVLRLFRAKLERWSLSAVDCAGQAGDDWHKHQRTVP